MSNNVPPENAEVPIAEPEPAEVSLAEVLKQHEIKLPAKKIRLMETYCQELWTWNEKINLTRHTDYEKFVTHDLIDSMHLADLLQKGEHVLDVGTGGGVPGILLAILRPDITVELCDSTGKKAKAVGAIVDALGLDTNVWYAKAENLLQYHRFHTLVIRAVSKMARLLEMFAPVWFAFDRMLLVKGPHWVEERGEARHYNLLNNIALRNVDEYETPGAEHKSYILALCRKSRFEELEQRNSDRLAGLPCPPLGESVGVDNSVPRKPPRKPYKPRTGSDRAKSADKSPTSKPFKSQGNRKFPDRKRFHK
ncbi:MAG: 16S rRNA (guanine(527)-N(7))-methyltransferase RsmG [Planctomycetia bacterium]|nr:16S rRNA (guanine(527)-N(7))-methyltransferase RsmG [Planctomycetia bacterium]